MGNDKEVSNGSSITKFLELMPGLLRNRLSLSGAALALVTFANIVFMIVRDAGARRPNPYLGIFAYMVLPVFGTLGVVLMLLGAHRERARRRKLAPHMVPAFPKLDFNDPTQRGLLTFSLTVAVTLFVLSAVVSYHAYHVSDSTQFCGQVCHSVMGPEYTAYTQSPHARVACVECHVGSGASWFVKAKVAGARRAFLVMSHRYPRPIPAPVESLRPAQDTCEQCHWPSKFYGGVLKIFTHFGYDEQNTPRQIRMLIRVGGSDPGTGLGVGIHWHMNIANQITYAVTDPTRQSIPWVQIRDAGGRVTVYKAKDTPLSDAQIAAAPKRTMDCVDCHDRPTHIYLPPDRAVDEALLSNRIDRAIPFIKQQAVTALSADYPTKEQALQEIRHGVMNFYTAKYPKLFPDGGKMLDKAIAELQRIYVNSVFPSMHVDWRTYPDNIGHFYSTGCFRCHDNNHVSPDGKMVGQDCNICHEVLGQEQGASAPMGRVTGIVFNHPGGELPEGANCADCHTGAPVS